MARLALMMQRGEHFFWNDCENLVAEVHKLSLALIWLYVRLRPQEIQCPSARTVASATRKLLFRSRIF